MCGMQVITASRSEWIVPFTCLQPGQFRKLVATVAERGGPVIADGRRGRPWSLQLPDRVLLVATYWRTNLTMRQIGPLFGVSHSAAHRIIDTLNPLLALAPVPNPVHGQITEWQEELNTVHRRVRARHRQARFASRHFMHEWPCMPFRDRARDLPDEAAPCRSSPPARAQGGGSRRAGDNFGSRAGFCRWCAVAWLEGPEAKHREIHRLLKKSAGCRIMRV